MCAGVDIIAVYFDLSTVILAFFKTSSLPSHGGGGGLFATVLVTINSAMRHLRDVRSMSYNRLTAFFVNLPYHYSH